MNFCILVILLAVGSRTVPARYAKAGLSTSLSKQQYGLSAHSMEVIDKPVVSVSSAALEMMITSGISTAHTDATYLSSKYGLSARVKAPSNTSPLFSQEASVLSAEVKANPIVSVASAALEMIITPSAYIAPTDAKYRSSKYGLSARYMKAPIRTSNSFAQEEAPVLTAQIIAEPLVSVAAEFKAEPSVVVSPASSKYLSSKYGLSARYAKGPVSAAPEFKAEPVVKMLTTSVASVASTEAKYLSSKYGLSARYAKGPVSVASGFKFEPSIVAAAASAASSAPQSVVVEMNPTPAVVQKEKEKEKVLVAASNSNAQGLSMKLVKIFSIFILPVVSFGGLVRSFFRLVSKLLVRGTAVDYA